MVACRETTKRNGREEGKDSLLRYSSGTIYAKTLAGNRTLVKDVSFSLHKGEKLSLIGETGSGKTMIALSLMGKLAPNVKAEGLQCVLDGEDCSDPKVASSLLGREVAYIPQNGMEFLNPARTVKSHLYDSLQRTGTRKSEVKKRAASALSSVGFHDIDKILKSYPFQLSGGMAQRVTVALALCTKAKLIIADEPTNGLDKEAASRMLEHLGLLFPEAGQLFITHDIEVASNADRILVLCGGRTMEHGRSFFLQNPRNTYAKCLVSSLVSNGMKATPTLRKRTGCPFSDRCPEYSERCRDELLHHREGEHEWWCNR
jgi:ABC-type dipeptide/oligopeptide/nickel transport system ATPase component